MLGACQSQIAPGSLLMGFAQFAHVWTPLAKTFPEHGGEPHKSHGVDPDSVTKLLSYRLVSRLGPLGLWRPRSPNHAARLRKSLKMHQAANFRPGLFRPGRGDLAMLGTAKALVLLYADSPETHLSGLLVEVCYRAVSSPVGPFHLKNRRQSLR